MTEIWQNVSRFVGNNWVGSDWWAILFAGFLLGMLLRLTGEQRKKNALARQPHQLDIILIEGGFKVLNECIEQAVVNWPDVGAVTMITTDKGPWEDDLFYHIAYSGGDLTLPSQAGGMEDWVGKLTALPGFDLDAYAQAIASAQNNSFVVVLKSLT